MRWRSDRSALRASKPALIWDRVCVFISEEEDDADEEEDDEAKEGEEEEEEEAAWPIL